MKESDYKKIHDWMMKSGRRDAEEIYNEVVRDQKEFEEEGMEYDGTAYLALKMIDEGREPDGANMTLLYMVAVTE